MSSVQSFSLELTKDSVEGYSGSTVGSVTFNPTSDEMIGYKSTDVSYFTLNDTAKSILFPNTTVKPNSITLYGRHRASGAIRTAWFGMYILDTGGNVSRLFDFSKYGTGSAQNTATVYASDNSVVANTNKSCEIRVHGNISNSNFWCYVREATITYSFTRYDFSATAGSNVSSTSVSSSTGYDGDTITYSCVLVSGAVFDGWYDGSTRVSTNQSYTYTVNGEDVALTAVATMSVTTKTLSATYNGAQISGFPKSVQSAVSLSYGGTSKGSIPLSGGTKTFSCGGKITSGTININGTNLNNSGKLMATDVVVTVV